MIRIICAYGPHSGRPDRGKVRFFDKMASEWDLENSSEMIVSMGDFNEHLGKCADGFEGVGGHRSG